MADEKWQRQERDDDSFLGGWEQAAEEARATVMGCDEGYGAKGLLGDFALRLVGGVVDLGVKAFEEAVEESLGVGGFVLQLVG